VSANEIGKDFHLLNSLVGGNGPGENGGKPLAHQDNMLGGYRMLSPESCCL